MVYQIRRAHHFHRTSTRKRISLQARLVVRLAPSGVVMPKILLQVLHRRRSPLAIIGVGAVWLKCKTRKCRRNL